MRNLFLLIFLSIGFSSFSQVDSTQPPFKRFPTVPPFKVMLKDSSYYEKKDLPKNKAVWIIVFSPDCDHCQEETRQIIEHKKELKNIQIVMITLHPMQKMRSFITDYKTDEIKNLVVAQDYARFTMPFFSFHNFPFQAVYDKKGNLVGSFEGTRGIDKVLEMLK